MGHDGPMAEQLPIGWVPLRLPDAEARPGSLLVAAPTIAHSAEFERTVILLLEHDEDGSLGVVLNRPTETLVREVLPEWSALAAQDVFRGGPVSTDCALALALVDGEVTPTGEPTEGPIEGYEDSGRLPEGLRHVTGNWALVNLDRDFDELQSVVAWMRVFAGYAGWSSGQLDSELAEGAWWVVPATSDDLLRHEPDQLWTEVIRRQPGDMRLAATFTADPDLN